MSIPVHIHQDNGHFVATLVGAPDVTTTAATKSDAIAEMQALLDQRFAQGELIFLDVPKKGVLSFAGKCRDDPTMAEIREEIYRQRDAEPKDGLASQAIEQKFARLRDEWKQTRGPHSSPIRLTSHPAYLKIIALGSVAVPLLLRELDKDPDLWFAALRAITEADPVSRDMRGNVSAMADAWLAWGKKCGYEW